MNDEEAKKLNDKYGIHLNSLQVSIKEIENKM